MTYRTEPVSDEIFKATFYSDLDGSFSFLMELGEILCFSYNSGDCNSYCVPNITDDEILTIIMSDDPHKIIRSWELVVIDYSYMA